MFKTLNKNSVLFYARIFPSVGTYDVCTLKVRTVEDTYFVGVDKQDRHAYLFGYDALGETVFEDRSECLKKVKAAEANRSDKELEVYYEED